MKKIIRWLADCSGVTRDIETESAKEIGREMRQYAYWFAGGLMHDKPSKDIVNVLNLYPKWCLENGQPHLYGSQFIDLRNQLYMMSENGECVFDEEKPDFVCNNIWRPNEDDDPCKSQCHECADVELEKKERNESNKN